MNHTYNGKERPTQDELEKFCRGNECRLGMTGREYDCLLNLIEDGDVTWENAHEYGLSDQELE